ncbi:MAG: hypothetical protein ACRDLD_02255 [Thermoleophilaceae bacterium]
MSTITTEPQLRELIGAERFADAVHALQAQDLSGFGPYLIDLTNAVLTQVDEIDLTDPDSKDRCHEIADNVVPVYTHEIMATISESIELAAVEPELGPAFDGSATPVNVAAANIYELVSNIAHQRLYDRKEA